MIRIVTHHGESKTVYYAVACRNPGDNDWEVIGTFNDLDTARGYAKNRIAKYINDRWIVKQRGNRR